MILPSGAKEILDARKRGYKPADLVIVSLVGKLDEHNPIVYVNPTSTYDWGWARGLHLCVFLRPGIAWKDTTLAIAMAKPEWLGIWNVDLFEGAEVCALPTVESIDRPQTRWDWRLNFIPWLKCQNEEFAWN